MACALPPRVRARSAPRTVTFLRVTRALPPTEIPPPSITTSSRYTQALPPISTLLSFCRWTVTPRRRVPSPRSMPMRSTGAGTVDACCGRAHWRGFGNWTASGFALRLRWAFAGAETVLHPPDAGGPDVATNLGRASPPTRASRGAAVGGGVSVATVTGGGAPPHAANTSATAPHERTRCGVGFDVGTGT